MNFLNWGDYTVIKFEGYFVVIMRNDMLDGATPEPVYAHKNKIMARRAKDYCNRHFKGNYQKARQHFDKIKNNEFLKKATWDGSAFNCLFLSIL